MPEATGQNQSGYIDLKGSDDPKDRVKLVNTRLTAGVAEMSDWGFEAERAWLYYQSHQWQNMTERERARTIPIVANIIRRDIDQMTSRILDAEPVVNPKGRHGRFNEFGKLLVDVVAWTRDEEENWFNDLEDVIQDCFHAGEGILYEGWNQSAANGLGMPESIWVDPRFVCWDWHARDWQRKDAEWIITMEPKKVDYLQKKYAKQLGKKMVEADYPSLHVSEAERAWLSDYRQRQRWNEDDVLDLEELEGRAYEKIMWEKRIEFTTHYLEDGNGRLRMVRDAESDTGERPMREEEYSKLSATQKKTLTPMVVETPELWRTVIINDEHIESRKSIYDKSNGGHGHYPFCFFSYVRIRNRSHAKGEIDYLVGIQDLINRSLARWLEQLMIAGSSFITSHRGSMGPEDDEKLENIGRIPMQTFRVFPGFEGPQIQGGDPRGAGLFAQGHDLLSSVKDSISGVYDVQRGGMPYQTSGRGIRALQSSTDLLGTLPRRHIESGLKQSTILRIANIKQFMRGSRLAEAIDQDTGDKVPLYIGNSFDEIKQEYNLQTYTDPQTGAPALDPQDGSSMILADAEGKQVRAIAFGEEAMQGVTHTKVTYELDTGKERNKEERMEVAKEFLQHIGPAAAGWAVEILDLPEKERLLTDMEQYNQAEGLLAQVDELSKATGMEPAEVMQMAMDDVKQAAQAQQQQQAFGAQPGQQPPQGGQQPPQGGPQMPPGMPPGMPPEQAPPQQQQQQQGAPPPQQ